LSQYDNNNNNDLLNDPESAIYINQNFNNNGITANLSKIELEEKENKILRFVIDYCRASPNINLNQKQIISLGWRNTKFHFDVDIELTNSLNYAMENVIRKSYFFNFLHFFNFLIFKFFRKILF